MGYLQRELGATRYILAGYKNILEDIKAYKKEILFSREAIQSRVNDLAQRISSDYAGETPILIGILNKNGLYQGIELRRRDGFTGHYYLFKRCGNPDKG